MVGGAIFIMCLYYIYYRFQQDASVIEKFHLAKNKLWDFRGLTILVTVFFLAIMNWFWESLKWKYLLKQVLPIGLVTAYQSVLAGLAFTIITPYRVGSFVGRIWNFPREKRYEAVLASVFGGLAQLFVTVCLGLIAIIFSANLISEYPIDYITIVSIVLLSFIVVVYFYPTFLVDTLDRYLPNTSFSKSFLILKNYDIKDKLKVLGYSTMRYLIFILQYYLLLLIFLPESNFLLLFWPLALVFFVLSVLPSIAFGLGVREASALLVLTPIYADNSSVIIASLLLWLINMMLPALVGAAIFLLRKQRTK